MILARSRNSILGLLSGLVLLSSVIVFLLYLFLSDKGISGQRLSACREAPTSKCLTDLGLELIKQNSNFSSHMYELGPLSQMGRFDEVHAIKVKMGISDGKSLGEARRAADYILAPDRFTAAIRRGKNLNQAIMESPGIAPYSLWRAAKNLLGKSPDKKYLLKLTPLNEGFGPVVSEIASKIEELTQKQTGFLKISNLFVVADIHAALGDREKAISALSKLPKIDLPDKTKLPYTVLALSGRLISLVGIEYALKIYEKVGGSKPQTFLNAGSVDKDAAQAKVYLQAAFNAYAATKPDPDFPGMAKVVDAAVNIGQSDFALELARQLRDLAKTMDGFFVKKPAIEASKALYSAGAQADEIRENLNYAVSLLYVFPENVISLGFLDIPVFWDKPSTLDLDRVYIAKIRAQLGDIEEVRSLIEGMEHPVISWSYILTPQIPSRHLPKLLDLVSEALTPVDFAKARVRLADAIMQSNSSNEHRKWARKTVQELMETEYTDVIHAPKIYSLIAQVARANNDAKLEKRALMSLAQLALDDPHSYILIRAGQELYQNIETPRD